MKTFTSGLLAAILVVGAWPAFGQTAQPANPANLDDYIKLLRADVRKEKAQVIGEALDLDAAQAAAFWPVYKTYEAELVTIGDERVAVIKDYAASYTNLTDAKATELTDRAMALEEKRLGLLKRSLTEFRKVLPAAKVARLYQVEMALNKVIDLQLASEIPLAQ